MEDTKFYFMMAMFFFAYSLMFSSIPTNTKYWICFFIGWVFILLQIIFNIILPFNKDGIKDGIFE